MTYKRLCDLASTYCDEWTSDGLDAFHAETANVFEWLKRADLLTERDAALASLDEYEIKLLAAKIAVKARIAWIVKLIKANRESIVKAMREANYQAYMSTDFKYEVHLLPDGSIETRERLASDDWWGTEDSSICQIARYCYQYYDALNDDMDLRHLLTELCQPENMMMQERAAYHDYLNKYKDEYEDFPDFYERLDWIKMNTEAYKRAYRRHVADLVNETDYDEQINDLIGDMLNGENVDDE